MSKEITLKSVTESIATLDDLLKQAKGKEDMEGIVDMIHNVKKQLDKFVTKLTFEDLKRDDAIQYEMLEMYEALIENLNLKAMEMGYYLERESFFKYTG